jgi:corrinoid protein of di/trimethylamine methyltransferase
MKMANEAIIADLKKSVETWDIELAQKATQAAIDAGMPMGEIIGEGLGKGMEVIGDRFDKAEIYLPQVVAASKTMEAALAILKPLMESGQGALKGTVIMGTVEGDIHEIGKNVCCAMLKGAGYNVIDLGPDVSAMDFMDAAEENDAQVCGGSALMTTTLESQRELVETIKEMDAPYKAIFGGAPCSQEWCDEIGADGYSETANEIITLVDKLVKG